MWFTPNVSLNLYNATLTSPPSGVPVNAGVAARSLKSWVGYLTSSVATLPAQRDAIARLFLPPEIDLDLYVPVVGGIERLTMYAVPAESPRVVAMLGFASPIFDEGDLVAWYLTGIWFPFKP